MFEDVPLTESEDHHLLLSFYDDDNFDWNAAWIPYVEVMLKEGCTPEQLKAEADARLEPCGLTVEVKSLKGSGNSISDVTRGIIWLAGSLILLSALISFLRMQVQLIRMRGREFALRRVNGASASKLFLMLFVEYAITVLLCTLLSLVMTKLLIGFADSRLAGYLSECNWEWNGIYKTILAIGAAMLAICTVIIAIWVKTTVRSGYTLMDNIRDSGGLMRKIMLAIQTVISMVFISGTLSLLQFVAGESKLYNIPDNERFYKQCILVQSYMINDRAALHRELQNSRLAQQVIPYSEDFRKRHNDLDDPVGKLLDDMRMQYIRNYHLPDTSLFGFYGMHIGWKRMPEPGESYVLLSEGYSDLYTQSGEPIPDMSSTSDGRMLPVLGTYTSKPYSRLVSERIGIAVITPGEDRIYDYYIMVPKKGQYQALLSDVQEVVSNLSPELVDPNVFNFRDKIGVEVIMLDAMRGGSLILSGICLIICAMSLYSTLLMSIRARRKEVAIRKVNGARKSDVAMMFGR
ncbi:MAG: ABC transporter permease, partial [Bacteroidaceae bacterium]|nr:ABC transporter permease [Bacteroidaceae bacterium]